jgi:TRAP-type C4-dicarboxylate transport system permease small subunit
LKGGSDSGAAGSRRDGRALRIAGGVCEVLTHAGMVLVSLFMVLQIVEIVGRKAFGSSILGLSEIGQLFVMSCICLAWPLVFCRDGHIAVEFVTDRLPPRALSALKAALGLLGAAFVGTLTYYGIVQARLQIAKGDFSATLHIPIFWYWMPLLLAMAVSGVACVVQTIRHAAAAVSGRGAPPAATGRTA